MLPIGAGMTLVVPPLELLELLHPRGFAERRLLVGERASPPAGPQAEEAQLCDLIVVRPSTGDLTRSGWLEECIASMVPRLAGDSLLVLLVPPRRRLRLKSTLYHHGLEMIPLLVQGPPGQSSLVPLERRTVALAQGRRGAWKRLATLLATLPFVSTLLATVLPNIVLVAFRPPASPGRWLYDLLPPVDPRFGAFVALTANGGERAYLHRFGVSGFRPLAVAKVSLGKRGAERNAREASALAEITAGAAVEGVVVPRLLAETVVGGRPVLLESFVEGSIAASWLDGRRDRAEELLPRLAAWLEGWNAKSSERHVLGPERAERDLIRPAEELSVQGTPLFGLVREAAAAAERPLPLVAAHNDLTMWNVVVQTDGRLGVLDWEAASPREWPLMDLFYSLADAAAACSGYADRLHAFRSCFTCTGDLARLAQALTRSAARSLNLNAEAVRASFLTCWLGHAARELREPAWGSRPFLEFVQEVGDNTAALWPLEIEKDSHGF
jgi:phosphotransferase family enzyme